MTAVLSFIMLAGLSWAAPAKKPPQLSEEAVEWLRIYPLAPYREYWTMTATVKNMKKDLPRVMQAFEKNGGILIVPLENAAGGQSAQQLSYRLTRGQGTSALKALGKAAQFAPPLVRQSGELLPVAEIERKIAALTRDKSAHERELAAMPAVRALVDAVLGHLVAAKAIASKTEAELIVNLTVQGPAAP